MRVFLKTLLTGGSSADDQQTNPPTEKIKMVAKNLGFFFLFQNFWFLNLGFNKWVLKHVSYFSI